MLNSYLLPGALADSRLTTAARGLAPATIRVGGITGDWLRYTADDGSELRSPQRSSGSAGEPCAPPLPPVGVAADGATVTAPATRRRR